ncbi:type I pullulanase [Clostridium lacusfryxellense]|uniref:type I pullulanase n=1 Tax=Clostridium lacusfryxellense TaxID=205328 RepID=UPI001C0CFE7A|nr:type I pullulanase [Clostridium lacusfryxellense]MBU3114211.1 type I pullulanase [Clostridium lacusfryxellense]
MNFGIMTNKKHTLIIIFATVLVMVGIIFSLPNQRTFAVTGKTKIIIHYAKNPSSELKWNLWVWSDEKNGKQFNTTRKDAFGQVFEGQLEGQLAKVGFIVRTSKGDKDTGENRYIEKFKDGVGEIWIKEGDSKIYTSAADATSKKVVVNGENNLEEPGKFVVAKLDDLNMISIVTNLSFPLIYEDHDPIEVRSNGKLLEIKKLTNDEVEDGITIAAKIELSENVELGQRLTISKRGFTEKEIVLGDVMGSSGFEKMFNYDGNDLGNTYSTSKTSFRVWAPTANEVKVVTYAKWDDKTGIESNMEKSEKGTWAYDLGGDQNGTFYTYKVNVGGIWNEAVDPYARSVSANGDKGAIINLKETNPEKWNPGEKPTFSNLNDAILYELHVRDFSIDKNSGMKNKGKFLALTETGTTGTDGSITGIDYIKDLGITHVELMPISDYASVNETDIKPQFNWGYNPKNYNAPEGSYSTDPYNPISRVKELKQAVQSLHTAGLRVTMDVVYSHMYSSNDSNFNKIVPGYYYKYNEDGTDSNESGYGNTIASENSMARKFIVDSVAYWAKEYNIDGFRFDLMNLIDIKTMNEVRKKLDSINPSIIIIGDGSDNRTQLSEDTQATQKNTSKMTGIAHFNSLIRNAISGNVFEAKTKGFVNGKTNVETDIKKGIVGGIDYSSTIKTWEKVEPAQSINYAESHSDNTLWDKLLLTNPGDSAAVRLKMHKMADSMILTSQGITSFQAGQEFLRTKGGNSNSYKESDSVNQIDWTRKSQNIDTVNYFKGLIALRKAHPAFRMTSAEMIKKNLNFLIAPENVVAYEIDHNANMDTWANIVIAFNANKKDITIQLPQKGKWNIVVNGQEAGVKTLDQFKGDSLVVPALSTIVIYNELQNIFTTLTFWIYTLLVLSGISCIIMYFKLKKKA